MRLLPANHVERITTMLKEQLKKVEEKLRDVKWRPLPKSEESRVYAVDGSQGKARLSGTIIYMVSSFAFGSGRPYRLFYTNAMLYNYGISDQMIRLQMETLENKLGYLAGKLGDVDLVIMDGTLTGSLTRPPVYPESVRGIRTLEMFLGKAELRRLVREFRKELDSHYRNLEDELMERGFSESPILADMLVDRFFERFTRGKIMPERIVIRSRESLPEKITIRLTDLERAANEGKTAEDLLREIEEKKGIRVVATREELRDAFHVVLAYVEYLDSLERLLGLDLFYVAKSFYTRRLSSKAGVPIVDSAYLDAILRKLRGSEEPGYLKLEERIRVEHEIPDPLRDFFERVRRCGEEGVHGAYVRFERGDVIYMVQSNKEITRVLPKALHHRTGGYLRPLQRAHEGVKISQREFRTALDVLMNHLRLKDPDLRVFVKYGRSPLE
ncbi:DNA double-strand break repair nuclease NurA [Pyrococcus yayanosii]|uniref:5'-3' nuclease n=1 Tax=Pyrococcus yayanosii (strain CH1 / JCM 16557) TaxID=529709 RepID=F8AI79_PYRYC|nr:DNA double-strand break repair nuclease NurA [Pyrococcus yayanosii]AEH24308.1 5'-3' nuclease [Pyrococcus yayanosii CH1]